MTEHQAPREGLKESVDQEIAAVKLRKGSASKGWAMSLRETTNAGMNLYNERPRDMQEQLEKINVHREH